MEEYRVGVQNDNIGITRKLCFSCDGKAAVGSDHFVMIMKWPELPSRPVMLVS